MSVVVPLKEKREIKRNSATMTVALTDADQITREYTAHDSSIDGAFLERNESSTQLPRVGCRVQLRISWPNVTYLDPVDISAEVVHSTDDGVGISFHSR